MFQGGEPIPDQGMLLFWALCAGKDGAAEFQKIGVDKIPADAVGDMDIFPAVEIEVGHEYAPAPICGGDACQLADLAEEGEGGHPGGELMGKLIRGMSAAGGWDGGEGDGAGEIAVIELQHIPHKLRFVAQ